MLVIHSVPYATAGEAKPTQAAKGKGKGGKSSGAAKSKGPQYAGGCQSGCGCMHARCFLHVWV
jgi:hypothetical protein